MPCRSVLMQISCLIRGICNYGEIAHHCFYLIRKQKVIVLTPWLGGMGAERPHPLGGLSWVPKGQRSLKPHDFVHPFTKTWRKRTQFLPVTHTRKFPQTGAGKGQDVGGCPQESGQDRCVHHAWPPQYPLSVHGNTASKVGHSVHGVLWRSTLGKGGFSWNWRNPLTSFILFLSHFLFL